MLPPLNLCAAARSWTSPRQLRTVTVGYISVKNRFRGEVVRGVGTLAGIEGGFRLENAVMRNTEIIYSAPTALKPPTTIAPASLRKLHAANNPVTNKGSSRGMKMNIEPKNNPNIPPPKAPILPQYFMRFPAW